MFIDEELEKVNKDLVKSISDLSRVIEKRKAEASIDKDFADNFIPMIKKVLKGE